MSRQGRTAACRHEVLAESEHVSIARCTGGTIHLQMGPVTLSLTPNEFAEVAAVVVYAIERLQGARATAAPGKPH
jgi:hypothetical protein